jgi:hypothetical protein
MGSVSVLLTPALRESQAPPAYEGYAKRSFGLSSLSFVLGCTKRWYSSRPRRRCSFGGRDPSLWYAPTLLASTNHVLRSNRRCHKSFIPYKFFTAMAGHQCGSAETVLHPELARLAKYSFCPQQPVDQRPPGVHVGTVVFDTLPNFPVPMNCPVYRKDHRWNCTEPGLSKAPDRQG